jgi:hypothetical protein
VKQYEKIGWEKEEIRGNRMFIISLKTYNQQPLVTNEGERHGKRKLTPQITLKQYRLEIPPQAIHFFPLSFPFRGKYPKGDRGQGM